MDDVTWGALTVTLTLLGGLYTWFAFRRRGFVAGLRGVGLTLLPLALLLTDTLRLVGRIGNAIGDWALHLAFSPATWLGIILAAVSVVCFVVAGFVADRTAGRVADREAGRAPAQPKAKELPKARGQKAGPVVAQDPELDEIEALLRKHGIS